MIAMHLLTACCDDPSPERARDRRPYCSACDSDLTERQYTALADCNHAVEETPDGRAACTSCGLLFCTTLGTAHSTPDEPPVPDPCTNPATTGDGRHCTSHAPRRPVGEVLDTITEILGDQAAAEPAIYRTRTAQYPPLHIDIDSYTRFAATVTLQDVQEQQYVQWQCTCHHPTAASAAECARRELLYQLGAAEVAPGYVSSGILGLHTWIETDPATGTEETRTAWHNVMMRT
ncbi:hypothetical protein [Actinomadura miaoliensis]|uniref:Uncharacterized protein n=1 Tax=Actinomadura miaoliensis TaxID=430685 RepID=A0ABP7WBI0_9ACTN